MLTNNEAANITIEALRIAQGMATLRETKDDIGRAIAWVEEMASLEAVFKEFDALVKKSIGK